jgi:hypothetical protein
MDFRIKVGCSAHTCQPVSVLNEPSRFHSQRVVPGLAGTYADMLIPANSLRAHRHAIFARITAFAGPLPATSRKLQAGHVRLRS